MKIIPNNISLLMILLVLLSSFVSISWMKQIENQQQNSMTKKKKNNIHSLATTEISFTGEANSIRTGMSVSIGGDVNGDGKRDMLIGADRYSSGTGRVYLIYGGTSLSSLSLGSLTSAQGITITGEGSSYGTGTAVSLGGDANGDGKADMLIGAATYNTNTGKVYLIYGGSSLSNIALNTLSLTQGITITGETTGTLTGTAVSLCGDVNNDGKADMLIGAEWYNTNTGRVYLIYGSVSLTNIALSSLSSTQGIVITGEATSFYTGHGLSLGGDVNGDGYGDIVIGAYGYATNSGRAYLVYGGPSLSSFGLNSLTDSQGIMITGEASGFNTARTVSIGDINDDTYADILIGAFGYNNNQGKVYLIFGGPKLTNITLSSLISPTQGIVITGESALYSTGATVAIGGDVNGDGYADMLIDAFQYNTNQGKVYLIYGGSALSDIALSSLTFSQGIIITGENSGYYTGTALSLGGDVDGDGKADMLISAYGYSGNRGKVYLLYGDSHLTNLDMTPTSKPSAQPSTQPSLQPTSHQPTCRPSHRPSMVPSTQPTSQPSGQPTSLPSGNPSCQPFSKPSSQPTSQPSSSPSRCPSSHPTNHPSCQPTCQPSRKPSCQPSSRPSNQPSRRPTCQPSEKPSSQPSVEPSSQPSGKPSRRPSALPTLQPIGAPSSHPSAQPLSHPTGSPSSHPTVQPTLRPSIRPSTQPSSFPTVDPSSLPSMEPSTQPSTLPSSQPSCIPSSKPSSRPSTQPTGLPTSSPSLQPSGQPSCSPSSQPSSFPSGKPSCRPSVQPSGLPSCRPSIVPTSRPSVQPSCQPSSQPSGRPSLQPTGQPSCCPSTTPSTAPSQQPTSVPSSPPTVLPSSKPSCQPSNLPSAIPSEQPSTSPSSLPSSVPSSEPSEQPSSLPSAQPSRFPSAQPSAHPSQHPSSKPSQQPSLLPTSPPSAFPSGQPTVMPTDWPSKGPSSSPTRLPSVQPSTQPTSQPSSCPISKPGNRPTGQPTHRPSKQPYSRPTSQPSQQPSSHPSSSAPTASPTEATVAPTPVRAPSISMIPTTTRKPTRVPTIKPTPPLTSSPSRSLSILPANSRFKGSLYFPGMPITQNVDEIVDINLRTSLTGQRSFVIFGQTWSSLAFQSTMTLGNRQSMGLYAELSSPSSGGLCRDTVSRSVASVGDINGDGFEDLVECYPDASKCLVYLGSSSSGNMLVSFSVVGDGGAGLGWSAAGLGDWNRDGWADFVVCGKEGVGFCCVIYGRAVFPSQLNVEELSWSDGFRIEGSVSIFSVGIAVAGAKDFNGDGYRDLSITAIDESGQVAVYIFLGPLLSNPIFANRTTVMSLYDVKWRVSIMKIILPADSFSGFWVAGIGDLNDDGFDDIAISSMPFRGGYLTQRAYVIFGRRWLSQSTGNSSATIDVSRMVMGVDGFTIIGAGFSVSEVGDVNDDGIADLMVSSYYDWHGRSNAYLVSLPSNVTSPPTFLPSSVPSSSPSLAPTSFPSSMNTINYPTNRPSTRSTHLLTNESTAAPLSTSIPIVQVTKSPILRKTNTPTTISPSIKPSLLPVPAPTLFLQPFLSSIKPSRVSLRSNHPTRYTAVPSTPPTTAITTLNTSAFSIVYCITPGDYFGKIGNDQFILNSPGSFNIFSRPAGSTANANRKVFEMYPITNEVIVHDFNPLLDLIILVKYHQFNSIDDLSYSSDPLTIYLGSEAITTRSRLLLTDSLIDRAQQQRITLFNLPDIHSLTASNFIFYHQQVTQSSQNDGHLQILICFGVFVFGLVCMVFVSYYKMDKVDDSRNPYETQTKKVEWEDAEDAEMNRRQTTSDETPDLPLSISIVQDAEVLPHRSSAVSQENSRSEGTSPSSESGIGSGTWNSDSSIATPSSSSSDYDSDSSLDSINDDDDEDDVDIDELDGEEFELFDSLPTDQKIVIPSEQQVTPLIKDTDEDENVDEEGPDSISSDSTSSDFAFIK